MPRELSADLRTAIEYYGDQAQTGEILIAPGVVLVIGIRNLYLDLGHGQVNVQATTWVDIAEARAEIEKRNRPASVYPTRGRW